MEEAYKQETVMKAILSDKYFYYEAYYISFGTNCFVIIFCLRFRSTCHIYESSSVDDDGDDKNVSTRTKLTNFVSIQTRVRAVLDREQGHSVTIRGPKR